MASPAVTSSRPAVAVSPARKAWMRFRRHQLAMLGLVMFGLILFVSIFAPVFERYPPNQLALREKFEPPSATHYLGTDRIGRDIWSRTLHGGRVSLAVGFAAALMAISIGVILGAVSGYYGGTVDMIIMRFTDVMLTFPEVVMILTVGTFVGQGIALLFGLFGLWSGNVMLMFIAIFVYLAAQQEARQVQIEG